MWGGGEREVEGGCCCCITASDPVLSGILFSGSPKTADAYAAGLGPSSSSSSSSSSTAHQYDGEDEEHGIVIIQAEKGDTTRFVSLLRALR